ncbi:MAG TPA: T9SS type A sorting domain-containing protein [Flavobacteriales bacterium]|nr:T9SS type A sorting domain-containing protein [Flavobacteriales bacterium]
MKHLYLFAAAAILSAASATAQNTKHPDGITPELRALRVEGRVLPWVNDQRGGGPANDDCAGAITLTVGTACNPTAGSLDGATESLPPAACSGFTASAANDVWFSFTATASVTFISVTGAATTADPDTLGIDPVLQLFTGDCGNLTAVGCIDATLPAGTTETAQANTTVGTTYYYRVYYWTYGGPPTDYSYTTCVYSPTAPGNDNCDGAIALTPGTFCALVQATGEGATESLPAATCNGFSGNANDDIWFSFVATQTTMTVGVQGGINPASPNTGYDAVLEAFSGANCSALTSLGCADATERGSFESLELTGLTVGSTYYFRTYHYYTAAASPYTVGACVVEGGGISISVPELTAGQDWVMFPNPAKGQVNLSYGGANGTGTIEIIDVAGRKALELRSQLVKNSTQVLDVQALSAGVYTVRVTVNGQRTEQRLVIE